MKNKICFTLSLALCLIALTKQTRSQTLDHLTMSLQNLSQPTDSTIQFDVYVVSDGDSASDLRANAFQVGINFNQAILQTGATVATTYISGTTDFPQLGGFNFPATPYANHIRIIQTAVHGANTGITMTIGQSYRVGTFQFTASAPFVFNQTPDFELHTSIDLGKTICGATVWNGTSTTVIAATVPGSGSLIRQQTQGNVRNNAHSRSSNTANSVTPILSRIPLSTTTGGGEFRLARQSVNNGGLTVYPNPAGGMTTVTFQSSGVQQYHLTVADVTNKEVMMLEGKAVKGSNHIDIDLSKFAKGVYNISLKSGDFSGTAKTVIQ